MELAVGGPLSLLILIFDVYAVLHVAGSRFGLFVRAAWVAVIILLPVIGFLIWLVLGPRQERGLFRR